MTDIPARRVGPWVLGEKLGSGGNASVWSATRGGDPHRRELKEKGRRNATISEDPDTCRKLISPLFARYYQHFD